MSTDAPANPAPAPTPPADAYPIVAEWLGGDYFLSPPPAGATVVLVEGLDKIQTRWEVPAGLVEDLGEHLSGHHGVHRFAIVPEVQS